MVPESRPGRIVAEMVIPLRWVADATHSARIEEMALYLRCLSQTVTSTTVVDGSDDSAVEAHRRSWAPYARIVRPDPGVTRPVRSSGDSASHRDAPNGKVIGAVTGIRVARHEHVVLADDDVRHTPDTISRLVASLAAADLVRPVNVYDGWPWQARWDGARTLLNHAVATDWPGTFALRRSTVLRHGGWCADALFENLEMWRTVSAAGGRVLGTPDIRVARRPPSVSQFWSQRVRQAYDDFAQPVRLVIELALLPAGLVALRSRPLALVAVAAASVVLAESGRRRLGREWVPPSVPLWAPVWLLERAVCVWLAVGSRLRGGVSYHGRRLSCAAHSSRHLRLVLAGSDAPRDDRGGDG